MADSKNEAIFQIRRKLEKLVLLRTEINSPYIEKYIDEAVVAIVNEIFNAIDDHQKKIERELRIGLRFR